jgi:putative ABC transport system permease protein
VTGLLRRASLRFYLRHPWQLGLAIAGISLGVGVHVGVSLANDSAARAFDVAAAEVRGAVTHRLLPLEGTLDERVYRELVLGDGTMTAAPVVDAEVRLVDRPGVRVPLLGIDPLLGERALRMAQVAPSGGGDIASLVADPGTVLLPEEIAAELGLASGGSIKLTIDGREAAVRVLGTVQGGSTDLGAEPPIVADIATAQELSRQLGRLDRIDLSLSDAQARSLAAATPAGTVLVPVETENAAFRELTAAFRTNLTALGLLALVVGMFLIYGTMAFAILQRTQTLGILRTLGVSRGEILQTILWETAGIAVVATALGLALGHVLALGLVELVLGTIGDLSFGAAVGGATLSPWIYAQGAALGLFATLLAAAKPALDAARIAPAAALRRAVLERRAHVAARRAATVALPVLAVSGATLLFGPAELYAGFAALFGVLAAGALLTPAATVALMSGLDRLLGRRAGVPVTLAVRGVSASLSRTGVAAAALAVAVATVNGVGLMIASFRASLDDWLQTTLTADIYLTAAEDGAPLAELVASGALQALPGVEGLTLTRSRIVPTPQGDVGVRGVEPGARGWGLSLVAGDPERAWNALAEGSGVVASERLLFARGLRVGDALELSTPSGTQALPIFGSFRDFNTGVPSVVLALERYRRDWGDTELTGVGLDLSPGADVAGAEAAVRTLAGRTARIRSSARLEELSLAVFDRTFKVTEVLRVLAGIVAFLGILSALLAIELERARELGVLRTLGFTPRGLGATLLTQTGLLGLSAGLAAVPIGTALALLLIHVINRRSFGWTMEFVLTPQSLASGLALAVVAALLAGIYPAWRASRIELGAALRED